MDLEINFFIEDIKYVLRNKKILRSWINAVLKEENISADNINYIFCSDKYLSKINLDFLKRETLTDVISFNYNNLEDPIEGDIYISLERVRENAEIFKVSFLKELYRVIVHGLLHLIGYEDKADAEKKVMTEKENFYLNKLVLIVN